MIKRENYLRKIRPLYNDEIIKVLVGMRRVGKSTLLKQIIHEIIESGVSDDRIIYINFESIENTKYKNHDELNKYIKESVTSDELYYLLIDEVQNIESFEYIINSLNVDYNLSIFLTGSNSNLLSGELATLLAGRYHEYNINPLSYSEWLELRETNDNEGNLEEYISFGGMPTIARIDDKETKLSILRSIYDQTIHKDISTRYNIRDIDLLNRIIDYLVQNTSTLLSIENILNYINSNNSNNSKITKDTISKYVGFIEKAFLIRMCKKFNLKGKETLVNRKKIYVGDVGFKKAIMNTDWSDFGSTIETIVFNHLTSLGYSVYFGNVGEYEIDFIATKQTINGLDKKYIQVSFLLNDDKTIEREFRPFEEIKDSYPKYIITTDKQDMSRNGIKHIKLNEFLLNDEF